MEKLERIVKVNPAYDKRHSDPSKNYGIHGAEMIFLLKGKKGCIQFVFCTNWQLPHVQKEFDDRIFTSMNKTEFECFYHPMAFDIGYHSPVPQYEDQKPVTESCEWLDGKPCYYDGSSLRAETYLQLLISQGSEAVWKEMEKEYDIQLG